MSGGSVRLNKHLAHTLGISRREADNWIDQGRVKVNGKKALLGLVVQPERDSIVYDETPLQTTAKRYTYVLMNKPVGYVCSRRQQGETPTIYSLLPPELHSLKVAGRLDKDSQGIILLTNDGDTIFKLTHPRFGKEKVYHVQLNKKLDEPDRKHIEAGVALEDGVSKFSVAHEQDGYRIIMHEGRNRQIRRTFKALGYHVTQLERVKLGSYRLQDIGSKPYLLF